MVDKVTRFRLFRSRAFWFGVPGLVFLLWAWGLSKSHISYVVFEGFSSDVLVGQLDGELVLVPDYVKMIGGGWWASYHTRSTPGEVEDVKSWLNSLRLTGHSVNLIPHGWLVAGYGLGWAGVIGWRWRKHRLGTTAVSAP